MKIKVAVKPNAKHEKIEKMSDTEYRVWVKAPPTEGKANKAVIKALAAYFSISHSAITLIHGTHSKIKILQVK